MKDRDITILMKIVQYAEEINYTISRFSLDYDKFKDDSVVKNAIAMCILQIGELSGILSDELKVKFNKVPWREIVAVRNRAVHAYSSLDIEILWGIATSDVPELKSYCENIIAEKETK